MVLVRAFTKITGRLLVVMLLKTVLDFLGGGAMPKSLNHIYIALIPKVNSPQLFMISDLLACVMSSTS